MNVRWAFAPLLAAIFVAGCGGGNSNVALSPAVPLTPLTSPTPLGTPTPVALPSQNAFVSQPLSAPLPTPNAGQYIYPLPAGGNYTGQVGIPTAGTILPPGVTLTLTSQNTLPAGFPVLQGKARAVQGARGILQASAPITPFYYLTMVWSGAIQVGSGQTFTIVPPAGTIVAGAAYYEAFYDPTDPQAGWQLGFAGPAMSADGKTLVFVTPASFTYAALQKYATALYAISAQAASPTPGPTSSSTSSPPTPAPSSSPTASPSSSPTASPSSTPTATPSARPTASSSPSAPPTPSPTPIVTPTPTSTPTALPVVSTVAIGTTTLTAGTAGTRSVAVTAKNAQGHAITGPYVPFTLTDSDASGATKLSVNGGTAASSVQVGASTDVVTLTYTGLAIPAQAITASGNGVTGSGAITTALQPIVPSGTTVCDTASGCISSNPDWLQPTVFFTALTGTQTFGASEAGWSNSPFNRVFAAAANSVAPNSCAGVATVSATPGTAFVVTPVGAGICSVTVTDFAGGQTLKVWINVTTTQIGTQ